MRVARVVPAVPSFSVDKGFLYSIPESMAVTIGTLTRVPLGGRRVRGYVVGFEESDSERLKPIAGVSGDLPIFDAPLLETLRWVAAHYVAPLSMVLEKAAPPNNPVASGAVPSPPSVSDAAPPLALIQRWGVGNWVAGVANTVRRGRSAMVVVATVAESERVSQRLRAEVPTDVHLVTGDTPDSEATRAWVEMSTSAGRVVVGTPRIALWPIASLGSVVVIEEARRAMKERQTPTVHVRDIVIERGKTEGARAVFVGPTPSVELVGEGAELRAGEGRVWPPVEMVDRSDETPGGSLITDRAVMAIRSTVKGGGNAFVFTHRRGYAAATRCVRCGTLRRCSRCGTRPGPGDTCVRCGEPLGGCVSCDGRRFEALGAGTGRVTEALQRTFGDQVGDDGRIRVGTERDLAGLGAMDLVVAVDLDGLLYAPHFRAAEEALRIMVRLAGRLGRRTGGRLLVQTTSGDHPAVAALVAGNPVDFLHDEMEKRRAGGYPPAGDLLVVETRGEDVDVDSIGTDLTSAAGDALVMGPSVGEDGARWLIQGDDLASLKLELRPLVQKWRDGGAVVRIDADPIDL